ncbi:hypothetical protein PFISCL1PPCAC_12591, partial [Pristionchus fissidentatus]
MPDVIEFGPLYTVFESIIAWVGVVLVIVTLPIYVVVVIVMITSRIHGTENSFFRIYMVAGIIDIAAILNNYLLSILPASGLYLNLYLSNIRVGQLWTNRACIIANLIQIVPAIFMGSLIFTSRFRYETNWQGGSYCVFADSEFQRVYFSVASVIQTIFVAYIVVNYAVVFRSFRRQLRQVKSDNKSASVEKRKQENRLLYISVVVCILEIATWIFSLIAFVIWVDIPLRLFYMIFNALYNVYACTPPYLLILFSTPFQNRVRAFLGMKENRRGPTSTTMSTISVQSITSR